MLKTALALAVALALPGAASAATTLFEDDFEADALAGNVTTQITNWDVTGSIDVIGPGFFPQYCLNGTKCIDMDGSAPGRLDTKATFDLMAGVTYTLMFEYAVNGPPNSMTFGITGGLFTDSVSVLTVPQNNLVYSQSFTAVGSGKLYFDSDSPGGVGGVTLDNVKLTADAARVPLPASAVLLVAGLGALGAMRRRR